MLALFDLVYFHFVLCLDYQQQKCWSFYTIALAVTLVVVANLGSQPYGLF